MIWFWGVLCTLALVVLFFPFIFWIDFEAGINGISIHFRFFKKKLHTYEKKFGKKESSQNKGDSVVVKEDVAKAPTAPIEKTEVHKTESEKSPNTAKVETPKIEQAPEKSAPEPETKKEAEKIAGPEKPVEAEKQSAPKDDFKQEDFIEEEKKEKRSLTDTEFWTLLLTPEFDTRAWWSVRHWLSALFRLFKIRFIDCFVEGFRMEYQNMGYAAAINGFLKSYPYIGDWDFRMDWTYDHDPYAEGHLRASVNLCRLLGLILATLFYGGIIAFTFWRRRAHILKTGELPELGFIRNKIVKMMTEDD